jgi:hypothetical protein
MPEEVGPAGLDGCPAFPLREVAHCAQNLASGAFSEAHLGHRLVSGVAHWLQNREPATLSVPHFEQRIGLPTEAND